jgi:hypothetical protein
MNSKKAKQQRRLAKRMAKGKPPGEEDKIYKRLKNTYKETKGEK